MTPPNEAMIVLQALLLAGELDEARTLLDAQLAAHPDDADLLREQIALDKTANDPERWRAALESSERLLHATVDDCLNRARLHQRLGDWESALRTLDPFPDHTRAAEQYLHIALTHADANSEVGSDVLERAAEIAMMQIEYAITEGYSPHIWQARAGDIAQREWRWNAALSHYTGALDSLARSFSEPLPPLLDIERGRILLMRAVCQRSLSNFEAAAQDYDDAQQRLPGDPIPPFMAALMRYLAQGMTQAALLAALPACREALAGAPPALADEIRAALHGDTRLAPLAQALFEAS